MEIIDSSAAIEFFENTDDVMAHCIKEQAAHHNPPQFPEPSPPENYRHDLYKMIVYQQISTKAAEAIWQRVEPLFQQGAASVESLREKGLSRQKAAYIQGIQSSEIELKQLHEISDEQVISRLTQLKGIGQWSAEMFLIFSLARPDIFSVGDLGLRIAVSQLYDVSQNDKTAIEQITKQWSPHRTIASLSLWHRLDNRPLVL